MDNFQKASVAFGGELLRATKQATGIWKSGKNKVAEIVSSSYPNQEVNSVTAGDGSERVTEVDSSV